MKIKDIQEDNVFKEFIHARTRSESTISNYTKMMLAYCRYNDNMTPNELLEEVEDEEETIPRLRKRTIKKRLMGYKDFMQSKGYSKETISSRMVFVKTFYKQFDIAIPNVSNTIQEERSHERTTMDDLPNLKDFEKVLDNSSTKMKALISLAMSSGMGSNELRHLKVSDFLSAHNVTSIDEIDVTNIPTWHIKRIKTRMPYYTFNSHEANRYVINYLEKTDLKPDDWLFPNKFGDIKDGNVLAIAVGRINDRCGFEKRGTYRFFHLHVIRKFFKSTCVNAGMNNQDAEWLLGHKPSHIVDIYTKPSIKRLKDEYLKILPHVSVTPTETVVIEQEELKKLKSDFEAKLKEANEKLQKEIYELQKEKYKTAELESSLEIEQFNQESDEAKKEILQNKEIKKLKKS